MADRKFYNFYGARISAKGTHANVSLVTDNNGQKEYVNATVKLSADKAVINDGYLFLKLKLFEDKKAEEAKPMDVPFN